ncbi:MAG: SecDF P1 head subdomain-containing protein [Dysgonomonas sp.]
MREALVLVVLLSMMTNSNNHKIQYSKQSGIETSSHENIKDSTLVTGWYYIATDGGFIRQLEKTDETYALADETYALDPCPVVTAEDIVELNISENRWKQLMLVMRFGKRGTQAWSIATKKAIGKELAFVLNDRLLYVPQVHNQITSGVSAFSRLDYTKSELEEIKQAIEINKQVVETVK